jgi:F-type H+-transporting ATPase subunit gamma
MPSTQQIRRRIGSVKSTKQITKAMQMVAASKLRRAQNAVEQPRAFSLAARELLTRLTQLSSAENYYLLTKRPQVSARLLIVISSDRTLAGAYNSNVFREYTNRLRQSEKQGVKAYTICVGRQVAQFAARLKGAEVIGFYEDIPDAPHANYIRPIILTAIDQFVDEKVDEVEIIYTNYISTVSQEVVVQPLLPAGFQETAVSDHVAQADFEPSVDTVLASTVMRLIEVQLYQALLDAQASEHSMRMLAMKNATDNAGELIDDLTLAYNNARQAHITQELAEISAGAEAMKDE